MFHDLGEEVVLTCAYGGPNQPKQGVRGRWLNAALTIGLACRLEQAILMAFAEQRMLAEPGADVLRISACGFTEPERGADLRAMRLNGATRPGIGGKRLIGKHKLFGHKGDDGAWDVLFASRKMPLVQKVQEEHGESKALGARTRAQQRPLFRLQRPLIDQFVGCPLALHPGPPTRGPRTPVAQTSVAHQMHRAGSGRLSGALLEYDEMRSGSSRRRAIAYAKTGWSGAATRLSRRVRHVRRSRLVAP